MKMCICVRSFECENNGGIKQFKVTLHDPDEHPLGPNLSPFHVLFVGDNFEVCQETLPFIATRGISVSRLFVTSYLVALPRYHFSRYLNRSFRF